MKYDYDQNSKLYPMFFNDMIETKTILKKYGEKMSNLESSKKIIEKCKKYNSTIKFDEIKKEASDEMEKRELEKKKKLEKEKIEYINMIERLAREDEERLRGGFLINIYIVK